MNQKIDGMSRFEQGVVFRVARGFFFLMAIGSLAVFLVGGLLAASSVPEPRIDPPPLPVEPRSSPPLSYQHLRLAKKAKADEDSTISVSADTAKTRPSDEVDRGEQVKALATKLRALFPDPPYAWENNVERYCAEPTSFGCLRQDVRVKRKGVVSVINDALKNVPDRQVVHVLEVLVAVLAEAPVEERGELVGLIVELERERLEAEELERRRFDTEVADLKSKQAKAEDEAAMARSAKRMAGLWALASGFGGLILLSMFLAFLAMERHLRVLERLLERDRLPGS